MSLDAFDTADLAFEHDVGGERGRGRYVEVSGYGHTEAFFLDDGVEPATPMAGGEAGQAWVIAAETYLRAVELGESAPEFSHERVAEDRVRVTDGDRAAVFTVEDQPTPVDEGVLTDYGPVWIRRATAHLLASGVCVSTATDPVADDVSDDGGSRSASAGTAAERSAPLSLPALAPPADAPGRLRWVAVAVLLLSVLTAAVAVVAASSDLGLLARGAWTTVVGTLGAVAFILLGSYGIRYPEHFAESSNDVRGPSTPTAAVVYGVLTVLAGLGLLFLFVSSFGPV